MTVLGMIGERRRANSCFSHAFGLNIRISQKASMATTADAGMVRIHAHTDSPRYAPADR